MKHKNTVCCILKNNNQLLLLKRGSTAPWYADKWAFVCGLIEEEEEPIETAYREIEEEIGIIKNDIELVKQEKLFLDRDKEIGITWHINPFLFKTKTDKIKLDYENQNYTWIITDELSDYPLAHGMDKVVKKLLRIEV